MSGKTRLDIFPSLANQVLVKSRVVAADKGFNLLKLKRGALKIKLRDTMKRRAALADNFDEIFSEAIFAVAKAHFLETDFKPALIIASDNADAWIHASYTRTIGLLLPQYEPVLRKSESVPLTGLAHGGRHVELIRDKFQETFRLIIIVASYDYSIKALKVAIHANGMRLNGLEHVTIPRLRNTLRYIKDELEEQHREEFFRLKCMLHKKVALREKTKAHVLAWQSKVRPATADSESNADDNDDGGDDDHGRGDDDGQPPMDKFAPLPLLLFMKRKSSSAVQTVITGHFPGSQEFISPTDSVISGVYPTIAKRSAFNVAEINVMVPSKGVLEEQAPISPSQEIPTKQVVIKEEDLTRDLAGNFPDDLEMLGSDSTLVAKKAIQTEPEDKSYVIPPNQLNVIIDPNRFHNVESSSAANHIPNIDNLESQKDQTNSTFIASTVSKYEISIQTDTPNITIDTAENQKDQPNSTFIASTVSKYEMSIQTDITGRYPSSELSLPPLNETGTEAAVCKSNFCPLSKNVAERENTSESEDEEFYDILG